MLRALCEEWGRMHMESGEHVKRPPACALQTKAAVPMALIISIMIMISIYKSI